MHRDGAGCFPQSGPPYQIFWGGHALSPPVSLLKSGITKKNVFNYFHITLFVNVFLLFFHEKISEFKNSLWYGRYIP